MRKILKVSLICVYLICVGSYKTQFVHDPASSCLMGTFAEYQCFLHPNYFIAITNPYFFFFSNTFPTTGTCTSLVHFSIIAKKVPFFPQITYEYDSPKIVPYHSSTKENYLYFPFQTLKREILFHLAIFSVMWDNHQIIDGAGCPQGYLLNMTSDTILISEF